MAKRLTLQENSSNAARLLQRVLCDQLKSLDEWAQEGWFTSDALAHALDRSPSVARRKLQDTAAYFDSKPIQVINPDTQIKVRKVIYKIKQ